MLEVVPRTQLGPIGQVIEGPVELRVHMRDVVALEKIVDVDFPIGIDLIVDPPNQTLAGQAIGPDPLGNTREHLGERRGLGRFETDEHEPLPNVDRHGDQTEVLLVKQFGPVELGHAAETTVELIRPAVVFAGQGLDATGRLEGQRPASMAADVVEGPEDAVLSPDHDHRIVGDGREKVGPGCLGHRHVADALPRGGEDGVAIDGMKTRVDVPGRRRRLGSFHRNDGEVGVGTIGERINWSGDVHRPKIGPRASIA